MKDLFYVLPRAFLLALLPMLIWHCQPQKPLEVVEAEVNIPQQIDYNFHVRPILSENCFSCHGPDRQNQKADLRLDKAASAYAELVESRGKQAIVPGSLSESEVYHRIISEDSSRLMPPPDSHLSLNPEQKATIIRWIEQGAEYKPHWAFVKPEKQSPPEIKQKEWVRSEIDNFVLSALEQKKVKPSEEADKATLIRRASFDLTGLPPSLEEVDAFLADNSPDAYEKVIDRLLASPAYGERMAAHWLEVARYADSDGYLDDKHRDFSPWRDWVIRAFNENMPYDQFVTWQLAGDLLPNATQEQVLATAFNRLHKKNSEAGIVFEEFRVEYVADRTNTLGKALLGLTLECARCHDHKYDPVSQKEYYQLFGFFNSTFEIGTAVYGPGQTPGPSLLLTDEKTRSSIDSLKNMIAKLEQDVAHEKGKLPGYKSWLAHQPLAREVKQKIHAGKVAHYSFDKFHSDSPQKATSPNLLDKSTPAHLSEPVIKKGIKGKAFFVSDYNSASLGEKVGWFERTEPFSVDLWVYPDTVYDDASVFYHAEELRLGLKGYSLYLDHNRLKFIMAHSWPHNALQVKTTAPLPAKKWSRVTLTYDGSSKAKGVNIYINGKQQKLQPEHDNLYKSILYEPDIHTYGFKGLSLGNMSKVPPMKNGGIDEISVYQTQLTPLEVLYLYSPDTVEMIMHAPSSASRKEILQSFYRAHHIKSPLEKQLKDQRDSLNRLMSNIREIMVMGDLPEPRPAYVLERGLYDAHGEEVSPATPEQVLAFPDSLPPNRLGLARWLFHADHPLTSRVIVNRIWQLHFGEGIVKTSDDFGNQGELPTHPALLDWLAVQLQEEGWDLKALHKRIMMSATYRQNSAIRPELQEKDPENKWLARGPRFRLPAEMLRDNALAISGLLVRKIGGTSVYPYQPEGLWDEVSNKSWRYQYLQEEGDGLYRRSIYTIWKRTSPPPSMMIFDAADRTTCTVQRRTTSTPLQALVLLNDPQYTEAAKILAERVIRKCGDNLDDRLIRVFRHCTGRYPDGEEMDLLSDFYEEEHHKFSQQPEEALAYLAVGATERDTSLPPAETAALAIVANAIMNTDEGYTRK